MGGTPPSGLSHASQKAFGKFLTVEIPTDEHQLASARFTRVPKSIGHGFKMRLHAVKNDPFSLSFDVKDAFASV